MSFLEKLGFRPKAQITAESGATHLLRKNMTKLITAQNDIMHLMRKDMAKLKSSVNLLLEIYLYDKQFPGIIQRIAPEFPTTDDILDDFLMPEKMNKELKKLSLLFVRTAARLPINCWSMKIDDAMSVFESCLVKLPQDALKSEVLVEYIIYLMRFAYDPEKVLRLGKQLTAESDCWADSDRFRLALCVYMATLHAADQHPRAKELFNIYRKTHGKAGVHLLWRYLPAAAMAYEYGSHHSRLARAHELLGELQRNEKVESFRKFIEGKKVAVVGNGPQEIGSGNGVRIDNYDVVIRFNHFPRNENHTADYGRKTDIWMVASTYLVTSEGTYWKPPEDAKLVITRLSPWQHLYGEELLDRDLYYIRRLDKTVVAFDAAWNARQHASYPYPTPTSGLSAIIQVKAINPYFSINDVFGMSFKTPGEVPGRNVCSHYFVEGGKEFPLSNRHNMKLEAQYFASIIA